MSLRRLARPFRPKKEDPEERASFIFPTDPTESSGGDDEGSQRSDQDAYTTPGRIVVEEVSQENSQDDDALAEESDQSNDSDDDPLAADIEITEGGWICQVERFEKYVDYEGRISYRHPQVKRSSPLVNQDLTDARKAETREQGEKQLTVQQSIISYVRHTAKIRHRDYIEPEVFIEIKSPLILDVLRKNTGYEQHV